MGANEQPTPTETKAEESTDKIANDKVSEMMSCDWRRSTLSNLMQAISWAPLAPVGVCSPGSKREYERAAPLPPSLWRAVSLPNRASHTGTGGLALSLPEDQTVEQSSETVTLGY